MGTTYYKSLLTKQEQSAYDTILRALRRYESRISLPVIPLESANRAFSAVRLDHAELFFLDNNITLRSSILFTEIGISFTYPLQEAGKLLGQMNRIANEVASKVRGMDNRQIATYLHNYLVERITYSEGNDRRNEAHSIVGALINHSCVCEGYAKAYKFLCDKTGVPCMVVTGTAAGSNGIYEGHAWNIVRIGQDCCHVDVTFDEYVDRAYCSQSHLFLSTAEVLVGHTITPEFSVPQCPRSHLPLVRVRGVDGFMNAVRQDQHKNLGYSEYVLPSYVDPKAFTEAITHEFSIFDLLLSSRIRGFFYSDCPKVNVIGVKWR